MAMRKAYVREMKHVWKAMRKNPKLRWAYARMAMGRDERRALNFYSAKLGIPAENVRSAYARMRNTMGRKQAVQQTVAMLKEIDEIAEALNLHSTPWLRENLKHRKPEDVLQDLQQQAQQQGLAA